MDDIIKIVKSLQNLGLLIDSVTETVKHEIKKQEGGFLTAMMVDMAASLIAPMSSSLIQPIASLLIKAITGKGVTRAEKQQEGGFFSIISIAFNDKSYFWKRSHKSRKRI